jgi:hypothetical protein
MPGRAQRDDGTPPEDIMTADLEGVEDDGTPYGLLKWGQAGAYNAVDDRVVITALADSQVGMVRGARFTAGAGLTVNVSHGWMGIASCDDGTSAVVSSNRTHQVQLPAGNAISDVEYVIWIDTNPNEATWHMIVLPRGEERTRPGLSLGVIGVPPNANLASQFRYGFEVTGSIGRHADGQAITTTVATPPTRLTPVYPLWPDTPLRRAHSAYVLKAYGVGQMGSAVYNFIFGLMPMSPAADMGVHVGVAQNNNIWIGARAPFSWQVEGTFQLDHTAAVLRTKLAVVVSTKPSHRAIHQWNTMSAVIVDSGRAPVQTAMSMYLQGGWAAASPGQSLTCYGSTFESYQPFNE